MKLTITSWVLYLVMVAKVAKFHMLLHVVMIKVFLHPSNVAPVQIPVTFPALQHTRKHYMHSSNNHGPVSINHIDQSQRANHYTKPPPEMVPFYVTALSSRVVSCNFTVVKPSSAHTLISNSKFTNDMLLVVLELPQHGLDHCNITKFHLHITKGLTG